MKIIAVELEGFWSFREFVRIDIADIPMLIGVGENGAGKSAILVNALDAAIFGRFPGRVIADSITEGAKRGFVAVEFELAGTKYRVTRTHPRSGAASGVVFVEDASLETGWRPITERGTKQATECMSELLGMSAEVASMTWLSAQGEHSKFADATPAARFALLSTVFGLDDYVTRAKAAHEKVKGFDQAIAGVNGQITEQQDSMLLGDDVEEGADPIRTVVAAELTARREAAEVDVDAAVAEIARIDADDPRARVPQIERELAAVTAARTTALDAARAEVAAADRDAAQAQQAEQNATDAATGRAAAARASYQRRIDTATATLDRVRAEAAEIVARAEKAVAARPGALTLIEQTQQAIAANRDGAAQCVTAANAERAARQVLLAQHAAVKVEVADCEARIATLERSAADAAHASCFTCAQHLSPADAAALIQSQRQQIATAEARKEAIAVEGRQHAANADAHDAARAQFEQAEKDAAAALVEAQARLARIDAAINDRTTVDARVAQAEAAHQQSVVDAGEEFAAIERACQTDVEQAAAAAITAHNAAAVRRADAEARVHTHAEPTNAEVTLTASLTEARAAADAYSGVGAQLRDAAIARRDAARAVQRTVEAEISRRAEIERARAAGEARLVELQAKLADLETKRAVVAQLHAAYSPGGIPSMVLNRVMKNVNERASTVLSSLSDGRMDVELRSWREKAGGGAEAKVTLVPSVDGEERDWANLSGGQQMRCALALRVALSQVVSAATATPVETIVLDEGFGSLDGEGLRSSIAALERLSETVNVIAVSHVTDVKESFASRVEVSRATGTSIARVVRG